MALAAVATALVVLAGCLPNRPASGRSTPVRRVVLLGDSMTFGLYGVTPWVHGALGRQMMERGISLSIDGFPGESPLDTWPGNVPWSARLQWLVDSQDPDVVIIQSALFVGAHDPVRQEAYRVAIAELLDIARSRGAHVYVVAHHRAFDPVARREMEIAERLQVEAASARGVERIPLDWWIARCDRPLILDGWHLTTSGQTCHATAVTAAIDQLRRVVGRGALR